LHERELYEHLAKQPARTRLSPKPQATLWPGVPPTDMGARPLTQSAQQPKRFTERRFRGGRRAWWRCVWWIFPVLAAFEVAVAAAADRPRRVAAAQELTSELSWRGAAGAEQLGVRPVGRPCRHPGELVGLDGAEKAAICGGF
jgi:hypothetical protein